MCDKEDFFCVTCVFSVCVSSLAWFLRFEISFILCFEIFLYTHIGRLTLNEVEEIK
jgi:hypothetical protein